MKFNGLRLITVLLVSSLNVVSGYECLNFEPQPNFDMDKFLGLWYAQKTTSPFKRCLVYDFYTQELETTQDFDKSQEFKSAENCEKSQEFKSAEDFEQSQESESAEDFEKFQELEIAEDFEDSHELVNINCVDCEGCKNCENCVACLNCEDCTDCIKYKDCIGCKGNLDGYRYFRKDEWDLENCINCKDCTNCVNCKDCTNCDNCVDLTNCVDCTNCRGTVDCISCDNSPGCSDCIGCSNTRLSTGCRDSSNLNECTDCVSCSNGEKSINCNDCSNVTISENLTACSNCTNCKNLVGRSNCQDLWLNPDQSNDYRYMASRPSAPITVTVPSPLTKLNDYYFTGTLEADPNLPSNMSVVSPPSDHAGIPSFVVFATDYENYAGVYSCQKTPNGYKHYTTILSRSESLDKQDLDDLVEFIESVQTNPNDVKLSTVDHSGCNHPKKKSSEYSNDQNDIDDDSDEENIYFTIKFKSNY